MATINLNSRKKKREDYHNNYDNRSEYYNTKEWKNLRLVKLMDDPLCEECLREGRTTLAVDVHHIRKFMSVREENRWNIFLDKDNLMSLCKKCHYKLDNL